MWKISSDGEHVRVVKRRSEGMLRTLPASHVVFLVGFGRATSRVALSGRLGGSSPAGSTAAATLGRLATHYLNSEGLGFDISWCTGGW